MENKLAEQKFELYGKFNILLSCIYYYVEKQQLQSMEERIAEMEKLYGSVRQMKHEMRNHITNIKGLSKSGNYEEIESYINNMEEDISSFDFIIKTGNAVTDVIINDKKIVADRLGIRFETEFLYPASHGYDAYDIGIIISNLLQNGIEACQKMNSQSQNLNKYITISSSQKKKFLLIKVSNSFEGEILFDKATGFPFSTKEDISLHGIGLYNVKRAVEKHLGDINITINKNEFCVTAMLQEGR